MWWQRALDGSVIISVCVSLVITVRRAGAWSWSWSMCCRMVWFSIPLPQSPEHLSVCVCSLNHRGFRRMCPLCIKAIELLQQKPCCPPFADWLELLLLFSLQQLSSLRMFVLLETLTVVSSSSSAWLYATASVGVKAVKPFVVWLRRSAQNQRFYQQMLAWIQPLMLSGFRVENQSIWFLFSTLKTEDRNQISWATFTFSISLVWAGLSISWKNGKIMSIMWKVVLERKTYMLFST